MHEVKDTITYVSKSGDTYKGICTWIDEETKECGVAILQPEVARGGCEIIKYEEAEVRVVEQFKPSTFRDDLSKMSPEELKEEIEKIRTARALNPTKGRAGTRPKMSAKKSALMKQLENLPEDVIDKLLEGK